MKIPETSANVGAYYGNEENGQWQPNGVIIESVGGGDAALHRPPVYPVHIPRGHIPMEAGYVMAGGYYAPAFPPAAAPHAPPDDFADYMWMEHEEEFDKQVMQQLEEEALMEQCIEAMLEDEQRERQRPVANGHGHYPTTSASVSLEEAVSRSTLNPLAAEFVPTRARIAQTVSEEKPEQAEAPVATEKVQEEKPAEEVKQSDRVESEQKRVEETDSKTEDPPVRSPPSETPEVSAADVQPVSQEKRPKDIKKDVKKTEAKKLVKQEVKPKAKPQPVKSEMKVQPKKKDVKAVKSEAKTEEEKEVEEKVDAPTHEVPKTSPSPTEESKEVSQPEFKPINYAAAAKASKPKSKPTSPLVSEKTTPPSKTTPVAPKVEKRADFKLSKPTERKEVEKKEKVAVKDKLKADKTVVKTEKPIVQRKNSMK